VTPQAQLQVPASAGRTLSPHNTRWRARRSGRRGDADTVDLPFGARVRVPAPHKAQPRAAHHPGPGRDPGPLPRGVPAPWRVANTWGAGRGLWGALRVGTLQLPPWLEQRDSRFAGKRACLSVASSRRECRPRDRHTPVVQCERGKMAQARKPGSCRQLQLEAGTVVLAGSQA